MHIISITIVVFVSISGIIASPLKGDHVSGIQIEKKLSAIGSSLNTRWNELNKSHHKNKHGDKASVLNHNENELTDYHKATEQPEEEGPNKAAILVTAKPRNEKELLADWIRSVPKNIFNMKNRMRLASLFLEAQNKDDVIGVLARVGGNTQVHHTRRRLGRRRRIRKRWPVPYHPIVRFAKAKRNGNRNS